VREKCRSDKSLAIAHDLEVLYVEPPAGASKGRRKKKMHKAPLTSARRIESSIAPTISGLFRPDGTHAGGV
jgi:hypothetical protein